ncbi:MAG TPA: hypothetical protein VIY28_07555 [Pseudonocardiaceae bacterium]
MKRLFMNLAFVLYRRISSRTASPDDRREIEAVEAGAGRYLGYVRVVGRRSEAKPDDPITSIDVEYTNKTLLRS